MKSSPATQARRWNAIILGALLCSLAVNVFFNFSGTGHARQVLASATGSAPPLGGNFAGVDRLFERAPRDGNICLVFEGFGVAEEAQVEMAYFRSCYSLFPKKVLVAPPATLINRGRDVLNANFHPPRDWLLQHDVSFLVEFVREPNGSISFNQFTISGQ